jgi:uncharacterized protein (TIGR03083 family)
MAYRHTRGNVVALLRQFPDSGDVVVPACPQWTILDVAEHLAGLCDLVLSRLDKPQPPPDPTRPAGPPRSGPRTEPTGCATLDELADYWTAAGERFDAWIAANGEPPIDRLMMDSFTHELDIRTALGVPVPDEHPSYPNALDLVTQGLSWSVSEIGAPALRVEAGGECWVAGEGHPVATVAGHRHDVYRSIVGRRTSGQIAELRWTSDPSPWLPAFDWGPFSRPEHPTEDLVETAA